MNVVDRVQELLKKKGYSVYRLAKKAELPYSSVANMMNKGTIPTVYTLEKICKGLDVTLAQFFSEDETGANLTENQKLLLDIYERLNDTDKGYLLAYAKGLGRVTDAGESGFERQRQRKGLSENR